MSACESSSRVVSPLDFNLVLRSVIYCLMSIANWVVWNADRVLHPFGQFFCFLGTLSWQPANAGFTQFLPHEESLSTFGSMSLVPISSAAVHLVVTAMSSEIANAATETAVMADVNSATVAGSCWSFCLRVQSQGSSRDS